MKKQIKQTEKTAGRKSKHPIVDAYLKAIKIDMAPEEPKKRRIN